MLVKRRKVHLWKRSICQKLVLIRICTPYFRFTAKDEKFVNLEWKWKQFRNPWTKEIEYLICKNHLLITDEELKDGGSFGDSWDMNFFSKSSSNSEENSQGNGPMGKDIQHVISSHADAAQIGRRIAEEAVEKFWYDLSASKSLIEFGSGQDGSFKMTCKDRWAKLIM